MVWKSERLVEMVAPLLLFNAFTIDLWFASYDCDVHTKRGT